MSNRELSTSLAAPQAADCNCVPQPHLRLARHMTHLAATHWARRRECAPVGKWHPLTPCSAGDADLSAVRAPQGCAALLASSFWDLARPVLYSYMSHINLYSYVVSGSGLGARSLRCASSTLITLARDSRKPRRGPRAASAVAAPAVAPRAGRARRAGTRVGGLRAWRIPQGPYSAYENS